MSKIELEWGQTPWDDMNREEMIRELTRYRIALESARGIMATSALELPHAYWTEGPGGHAIAEAKVALSHAAKYDAFRTYFRHAACLLFPETEEMWAICDHCKTMAQLIGEPAVGTQCWDCRRKGITSIRRAITWDDLKPLEPASQPA